MIKKILLAAILIAALLYLTACQEIPPAPETGPVIEPAPTTEDTATDIESDISDAGTLDEDLDLGDLENIDQELDDIAW